MKRFLVFIISASAFQCLLSYPAKASFTVSAGTVTLGNNVNMDVKGDIIVEGGGSIDAGNGTINVGQSWTAAGSFDSGTSTVTLYSTAVSTLTGNTTFYNLASGTPGKQFNFTAGSTQTVTNKLTLSGSSGSPILLRSTSAGTQWFLQLASPQTASYLDVQDSSVLLSTLTLLNSTNSGNNGPKAFFSSPLGTQVGDIIINEIMYNPDTGKQEWVEFYNKTGNGIDLTGWRFVEAGTAHILNSQQGGMVISAGGYAILADSAALFLTDYSSNPSSNSWMVIDTVFSLSNTSESLAISSFSTTSVLIDTLTYSSSWNNNVKGKSIERKNSTGLSTDPSNWQESASSGGTPGAANSVTASTATPVVSVVYDNHSSTNMNNYGVVDGIEDADGVVAWDWPFVPDGGTIENYFIEISADSNFGSFSSSSTLAASVNSYTVSGLVKGLKHYARVRAKNTGGITGPWKVSDGIYVDRKNIDGSSADWPSGYGVIPNTVAVSAGDVLWRDAISDQRTDKPSSSQLDISSFAVSCDEFNIYFFIAFNSTTTAPSFDGRNYIQIMLDNGNSSNERVFRGRGVSSEDSYVSGDTAWEYILEGISGNDIFRVQDNSFGNTSYGKYTENNAGCYYEFAMPLAGLGGKDKFLGRTVNFTVAGFLNDGGNVGQWVAYYSNIVDVITSSGPNTWNESADRVVDFYISSVFSSTGPASSARGVTVPYAAPPAEPEPLVSGISPAPPSALDNILYNIFIDAFYNGDTNNDDIADTNDYGGDFQGVIDKAGYLNDMGINMAYFGPPTEFGGGIWGFNIDDAYKQETKFGGTQKYIEMVKTLHNRNINVMIDWVCGQVGSKDSPTAKKNPDYFTQEQFGWGTKQEFTEPRAFWLNNMVWYFSICDAFRYDNPKFWNYSIGPEEAEFNRALRKISDRWDPQLFIMGEIPEEVSAVNDYTGSRGPMLHGGEDMRSGGYKDNRNANICSWVRPGGDNQSTLAARNGIENQQVTWKNQWSINPLMMENHDEKRFISRDRADDGADWNYDSQVGYMTAFTVGGPAILFYGGEIGLEGPYDGGNSAKMDRNGNVREMPWSRLSLSPWSSVQANIRKTVQAKANFPCLRGDPKSGGRSFYTGFPYDGDVMVYARTGWGGKAIVMMNRSAGSVTLNNVGTLDNNTKYKDWLTDDVFTTDGLGNIGSISVGGHYGRILIRGTVGGGEGGVDPYDWANVTGTVTSGGLPVANAIIDIDKKSHWTTQTDNNGYYSLSGDMKKVLTGNHTIRCWAPGYQITEQSVNVTNNQVNNSVNFTISTDNTPPAAPSTLNAQPRDKAVMLSWQANTEPDIQSYIIYRSSTGPIPDGAFPVAAFEVLKNYYYDNNLDGQLTSDSKVYDRLENGATYWYRIRAVDRNGNKSGLSNQLTVIPRAVKVTFWVDTRDSGVLVSSVSIAGGALTFSKNFWETVLMDSNGDGTFQKTFEFDDTSFIEYKYVINSGASVIWEGIAGQLFQDGSLSNSNRGELMDDSVPKLEVSDEGGGKMLVPDVWRYYYDRPPKAPSGANIYSASGELTVSWTKNAEPDIASYNIYRSTSSASAGFAGITSSDKNTVSYDDLGLVNANTYYYKIAALDRKGNLSSYSAVVSDYPRSADTVPPAAPAGLDASGGGINGLGSIKIIWNPNYEGDLAGYNIHRSTAPGFSVSVSNKLNTNFISPAATYYIDAAVTSSSGYYYKLVAADSSGNYSSPSAEFSAVLVPVRFEADMGNINPEDVQITGDTEPLGRNVPIQLARLAADSSWYAQIGFISGKSIRYRYAYNNLSVKEQNFSTPSQDREYTVPASTASQYDDWEENPAAVANPAVYTGINKVSVYWDRNTTAEDILGYNIYKNDGAGGLPVTKLNPSPVSYSQPYQISNLTPGSTYLFLVRAVDSGYKTLESSTGTAVSAFISQNIVYVNFGVPYGNGMSNAGWGDSSKIKLQIAVMSSTQTSVWNTPERADITGGKMDMTPDAVNGTNRVSIPLLKGNIYNFLFFAQTTNSPPSGLTANTEYYDTVPNTGTFIVSTSANSVAGPQTGYYWPSGVGRDARRVIEVPASLADSSTWYVFANFGSTPTAPTYIQAVPGNGKVTLYWSNPYGEAWTRVVDNQPLGGGEGMKAADVVSGGVYQIYMAASNPGDFASYTATVTVPGNTFSYTFSGLANGSPYYYIIRSSDNYRGTPGGIDGNSYSSFSSTVSATPTAQYVVTKIRVNKGADPLWRSIRKSIVFQEGMTIAAWDTDGKSNITPGGRAVNMVPPPDDPNELEFSANLMPGTTYNFTLFAYSTFSITGLSAGTTYFDTVPTRGSYGMTSSTSMANITNHGEVWYSNVGATGEARRMLYVPELAQLGGGATLYVYCNFAERPVASSVFAFAASSHSVLLNWVPYGNWGMSEISQEAADVIAGGSYYLYRSSISASGPYALWASTNVMAWVDDDRDTPGDGKGLTNNIEYFYVIVASDAYRGAAGQVEIQNLFRQGAPEFSVCDASFKTSQPIPVYFKVDERKRVPGWMVKVEARIIR